MNPQPARLRRGVTRLDPTEMIQLDVTDREPPVDTLINKGAMHPDFSDLTRDD